MMQAEVYSADMTGAITTGANLGVRHVAPAVETLVREGLIDPLGYA